MFDRVGLGPAQLFRLVGVGLSHFQTDVEAPLFAGGTEARTEAEAGDAEAELLAEPGAGAEPV